MWGCYLLLLETLGGILLEVSPKIVETVSLQWETVSPQWETVFPEWETVFPEWETLPLHFGSYFEKNFTY